MILFIQTWTEVKPLKRHCKNQKKSPIWTAILLRGELWAQALLNLCAERDVSCSCKVGCYRLLTNASCKRGAEFWHHRLPAAEARFAWEARLSCRQVGHGTKHQPGCSAGWWACTKSELPQRSQQERLAQGHLRGSYPEAAMVSWRGGRLEEVGEGTQGSRGWGSKQHCERRRVRGVVKWASTCHIRRQTDEQNKKRC